MEQIAPPSLKIHRQVAVVFGVSLALIIGGLIWARLALGHVDQPLIIHWNNIVRINQIGSVHDLDLFGFFSIVVVLVNFVLAMDLEERDWFWGKMLAGATVGFAILIFIGFAAIISVN